MISAVDEELGSQTLLMPVLLRPFWSLHALQKEGLLEVMMFDFSVRKRLQIATDKRPIAHMQRIAPEE